jgi:hypothetical protein
MKDTDRGLFIKILPGERADKSLDGEIYFNTDKYFFVLDSKDKVRSDPDEDIDESWQVKEISIKDKESGEYIPIGGIINPVKYRYENRQQFNIFCVYILLDSKDFKIDDRILQFGDTAIVIRDAIEFTKRLHKAANEIGLSVRQHPIEYVEKAKHHGVMGPFRKYKTFRYQSEFRYLIGPGNGEPIKLQVGDLRGLCFSIPSTEIYNLKPKYS